MHLNKKSSADCVYALLSLLKSLFSRTIRDRSMADRREKNVSDHWPTIAVQP